MSAKETLLNLFVSCASGVEPWLDLEVRAILPKTHIEVLRGGIALKSDLEGVMKLNLECRLAMRVLIQVIDGPYNYPGHTEMLQAQAAAFFGKSVLDAKSSSARRKT